MTPDDEAPWTRQLLAGLAALVAVSLIVGGVMAAVALGATRFIGVDQAAGGGPRQEPSLYIPSLQPTTTPEAYPDPTGSATTPSPSAGESPSETESPARPARAITLQAFPARVAPGERINLTGVYRRGEGATLQVQRFDGGAWGDFADVTASVSGGIYTTYVLTSRTGVQRFRMLDVSSGRASNPVRVRVG